MIFSDRDIKKALQEERIILDPYEEKYVQPASYDLHLGNRFLIFKRTDKVVIDVKKPIDDYMTEHVIEGDEPFVLHPGEFALGITHETIGVDNKTVGRLEGKSSLGRLGILVHATAGYLDPGNTLKMTLELHNVGTLPVMLYHLMPIGQIAFSPLCTECEKSYKDMPNQKYFGDLQPQLSKMYKNFKGDESQN